MKSKRLNWTYDQNYFEDTSNVTERIFEEDAGNAGEPSPPSPSQQIQQFRSDYLEYDTEYYNTLRDNIIIPASKAGAIPQLIAVTAPDFNQGVSSVASKLALTLAKSSERPVLLVDSNFAKPSVHTMFNIPLSPGFGEMLLSSQASIGTVHNLPFNNLHILPAGDILVNPTDQLDSKFFTTLLANWRNSYEFVLFDTFPLQCNMQQCDMNSSIRLASLVDGVILVIQSEAVRREVAQNVKTRLDNSKANVLGVVLNKTHHYIPKWVYRNL